MTFGYQWRRGSDDPGATSSTYHPVDADVGAQLAVRVTASKAGFADGTATSARRPAGRSRLAVEWVPVTDHHGQGPGRQDAHRHAGRWGPAPVTLTYQWLRNGTPIAGATGSTYKLKNKDKGKKISVRGHRREARLHLGDRHLAADQEGQEEEEAPPPRGHDAARLE